MTANRVLIPGLERIPARPSGAVLVLTGEAWAHPGPCVRSATPPTARA
ncbi:hypothetical protein [Brevundimonas abyssalis]|uniref:Uncharacterized protein n=1 Tax=Brevundimonas abyssalis TAR-001 TaxID=1391729 RepID=A0A8E0KJX2_9CAUL|nr:hypothetical protein [Brevundimonas abyssalis]GAD58459.1 hypothetical protein MBEBAB_0709 [Brevundimonas abyssalis TAR-001]